MPTRVDTDRVQQLAAEGAQLVEVLPAADYAREHLPGAVSIPLDEIASATDVLDRTRPVVVYCYDYQCDLSSRAAARLEQLGFREVYDYVASKMAWLAAGLPSEGLLRDDQRACGYVRRDLPTVTVDATPADVERVIGDWEVAAVMSNGVVVGVLRPEIVGLGADVRAGSVMQPAPTTVRPSIPRRELAHSMDKHGEPHVLVTTLHGQLLGLVRRSDLDVE